MADCQLFNQRVADRVSLDSIALTMDVCDARLIVRLSSRNADRVLLGSIAVTVDVNDAKFVDRLPRCSNGTAVEETCGIDPELGTAVATG